MARELPDLAARFHKCPGAVNLVRCKGQLLLDRQLHRDALASLGLAQPTFN